MRKLCLLGDIMRFRQINVINDGQFFQIRPVGLREKCTQTRVHLFCIMLPIHCFGEVTFVGKFLFKNNRKGLD